MSSTFWAFLAKVQAGNAALIIWPLRLSSFPLLDRNAANGPELPQVFADPEPADLVTGWFGTASKPGKTWLIFESTIIERAKRKSSDEHILIFG